MTTATTTWKFNGNYRDREQVAQFTEAFMARFAEVDATLRFAYNRQFKGFYPGLEGKAEDTAIFLLQEAKRLRELDAKVAAAIADGCVPLDPETLTGAAPTKFDRVVNYAYQNGEDGYYEWADARLVPYEGHVVLLPKGKRTHGFNLVGKILVK